MRCACIKCIHNSGSGFCDDYSYITIDEDGCCEDLLEIYDKDDEELNNEN